MGKKINENALVCIINQNNILSLEYIDFETNPLESDRNFSEMIRLSKSECSWKDIRDLGYNHFMELKHKYRKYLHQTTVLTNPNSAFAEETTIGYESFIEKIGQRDDNQNTKYYIFYKDEDHKYGLSSLIEKISLTFTYYLYMDAVDRAKKRGVLAYSHRNIGWNTAEFQIDRNFRIDVNTNFGYGYSSYFTLTIVYNKIPIIPYTKIIYYRYVNASSILHCTDEYPVSFASWEKCFDFVVKEINAYNSEGKDSFIDRHINKSICEFTKLLGIIMQTDVFYFVDVSKIDSYLDLNDRDLIYDYEYLLNNENPGAIDETALRKFVEEYEKIQSTQQIDFSSDKLCSELTSFIMNSKSILDMRNDLYKDRYAYAIAMLLSKYHYKYDYWKFLNDDVYSNKIQYLIRKILKIEDNYRLLIFRKSGYDLITFRNERVELAIQIFDNIRGLEGLINSNLHIEKINSCVITMIDQNKQYIKLIEPLYLDAKTEFEKKQSEYTNTKSMFESTSDFLQHSAYIKFMDILTLLFDQCAYQISSQTTTFHDNFDTNAKAIYDLLSTIEKTHLLSPKLLFGLSGFGNDSSTNPWSVGGIRKKYESTKDDKYRKALTIVLTIIQNWDYIISSFSLNIEVSQMKSVISAKMIEIAANVADLKSIIYSNMTSIQTFCLYKESYFSNHGNFVEIKERYDIGFEVVEKVKTEMMNSKRNYEDLKVKKGTIEEYLKKMEESIK